MAEKRFYATGKRKRSIARVWIKEGNGTLSVNDRNFDDYFIREIFWMIIEQFLELTNSRGKFDIVINVCGGGIAGQADAVKHGLSRVFIEYDAELRPVLKKAGFLTRDSRMKERKKYGQPGARKRFQFSKR